MLCCVNHELLYTLVMPHTDSIWVSLRARQPNPSLPTLSLHVFSRAHHHELSLESQINLPLFGCIVCIPVMSGCSAVSMLCTELVALSVLTRKSLWGRHTYWTSVVYFWFSASKPNVDFLSLFFLILINFWLKNATCIPKVDVCLLLILESVLLEIFIQSVFSLLFFTLNATSCGKHGPFESWILKYGDFLFNCASVLLKKCRRPS